VLTEKKSSSQRRHRRSIRLKGYDYSQPGAYFLTICTHNREVMFGEIVNGEMKSNEYGEIVLARWHDLPNHHAHLELDAFVVMPNHVHGIVIIKDVRPIERHSLSEIVRGFKTFSSQQINKKRGTAGIPVWQRNYWEHVVRNQEALNRIRNYILTNPERWHLDRENPERKGEDDFDRWLNSV
jgi:putative transposase